MHIFSPVIHFVLSGDGKFTLIFVSTLRVDLADATNVTAAYIFSLPSITLFDTGATQC